MRAGLLAAVVAMLGLSAAGQVQLTEPVDVSVPASIAGEWWTVPRDVSPSFESGPELQGIPQGHWRIDAFDLRNGSWKWSGSYSVRQSGRHLPRDERNESAAILVRDPNLRHRFGWAEYRKSQTDPVRVSWFSNVPVDDPDARLWSAALEDPIAAEPREASQEFRRVPDGDAFACSTPDGLSRCVMADVAGGSVRLAGARASRGVIFVLDRAAEVQVLGEGRSIVRPVVVEHEHLQAGRWHAVLLPAGATIPHVFDWRDEEGSVVRVPADAMAPLPAFTRVLFGATDGIEVRAFVGAGSLPVSERDARLLFLADGSGLRIPLVVAGPPDGGVFRARLPSGRYRLKLLAANAPPELVTASIESAAIANVRFVLGRSVRGRLILASAGAVSSEPVVQVVLRSPSPDTTSNDPEDGAEGDPVDLMRQVVPNQDGSFEFALREPGDYSLRAQWATARAERHFTLTGFTGNLDLGEIVLTAGASLQGTLSGCAGGELHMTPLPQPGARATFFDFQRVPVRGDSGFSVEGLPAATWILGAVCGGTRRGVTPEMIELSAGTPMYGDFRLTAQ